MRQHALAELPRSDSAQEEIPQAVEFRMGSEVKDELGALVPSDPLDHDILTGSTTDGNLVPGKTCADWTDSTDASGGQVGHADIAAEDLGSESWNSQHDPQCSEAALNSTAGTGRIYCFAID